MNYPTHLVVHIHCSPCQPDWMRYIMRVAKRPAVKADTCCHNGSAAIRAARVAPAGGRHDVRREMAEDLELSKSLAGDDLTETSILPLLRLESRIARPQEAPCGHVSPARSPSAEVLPNPAFLARELCWAGIIRSAPQYLVLRCRECCQGFIADDEVRELPQMSDGFPEKVVASVAILETCVWLECVGLLRVPNTEFVRLVLIQRRGNGIKLRETIEGDRHRRGRAVAA